MSSTVMNTLSTLVDLKNGREIWRGEGSSSGDEVEPLNLLLSAGEAAIGDLAEKGILPQKNKPPRLTKITRTNLPDGTHASSRGKPTDTPTLYNFADFYVQKLYNRSKKKSLIG